MPFLVGFALLWGVLAGLSEIDATGRWPFLLVGVDALLVAAVTSISLAYPYPTGRSTLWAPALVHTAIDSFKLVVIPPEATPTFSVLLICVSLFVPLLAITVPRRVLLGGKES